MRTSRRAVRCLAACRGCATGHIAHATHTHGVHAGETHSPSLCLALVAALVAHLAYFLAGLGSLEHRCRFVAVVAQHHDEAAERASGERDEASRARRALAALDAESDGLAVRKKERKSSGSRVTPSADGVGSLLLLLAMPASLWSPAAMAASKVDALYERSSLVRVCECWQLELQQRRDADRC